MCAAVAALACLLVPSAAHARDSGARFFGVVPQAPLSAGDVARMGRFGLGVRLAVPWAAVEPAPGRFEFAELDRQMGAAADRGVAVLPVLAGPVPAWTGWAPTDPPTSGPGLARWRSFVVALVKRYGPGGAFWTSRPRSAPIHEWQIWNEPNFKLFWRRPSPARYARLLHAAAGAIRSADRSATILAGGLAPIEGSPPLWSFLRRLYQVPGARRDFDVVAIHPYAVELAEVLYALRRTRAVMSAAGDAAKPIAITELGVASDAPRPTPFDLGPAGQAFFVERVLGDLYANRLRLRLMAVYWYAWQDGYADLHCSFCQYAGLFDAQGQPKPAWSALRRVLRRAHSGSLR